MKTTIPSVFTMIALTCVVAYTQNAHAVIPPPDGGYPGGNTAEGQKALSSLTSGGYNTAVGFFSLYANTTGSFNTAVGVGALDLNTGDSNTATGAAALLLNTTGANNTANGARALLLNTTGTNNTAVGLEALANNTVGGYNTASGVDSLHSNTSGAYNAANGSFALSSNTTGSGNTASGQEALYSNTVAGYNTASGIEALFRNTTGGSNTAIGSQALYSNTEGYSNTAVGFNALAGSIGNYNVALGQGAGGRVTTANNVICIGTAGADVSNSCYIGGIAGQTVGLGGSACYVDNDGKLGVFLSARRFKTDISDMDNASEALLALRPVTFHYKPELDKAGIPQFGLIAEEVEAIDPDLVVRDKEGKISTVRYEAVNIMLLNEFLKEHRKVQELEKGMATLTAQFKEQATQLQKVSALVEASTAPRRIANGD
jgi:hypothetical protein